MLYKQLMEYASNKTFVFEQEDTQQSKIFDHQID